MTEDLISSLCRTIDDWNNNHPTLSYFDTITALEGVLRTLRQLADDEPVTGKVLPFKSDE